MAEYREATFVVIIESNTIQLASSVGELIESARRGYVHVLKDDPKRFADRGPVIRTGTRTTRENKPVMMNAIGDLLFNNALRFHARFVACYQDLRNNRMSVRQMIVWQMRCLKFRVEPPRENNRRQEYVGYYICQTDAGERERDDFNMAAGFVLIKRDAYYAAMRISRDMY